ncbi:hypothetical protein PV08_10816 [Exophiala spinifera]|uniref:Uncharacterized protein n=1 Tax=Exophiala spinifera TaxID=91928 RepID=A0A0D2AYQ2_9EURO|nr:uncharacterized protein PV08_10816 [Exophiala spinifera]KIW11515.1 hypothetical protein PV08_10816 [Exophiala spinifera]
MPTILTPQGWVKVAPAPRKKVVKSDPTSALRGPLAYFSCQQLPSSKKEPISRPQYPYDLSASPEKLKHQGEGKAKIAGKNRVISAPQLTTYDQDDIDGGDGRYKNYEAEGHWAGGGGGELSPPSSPSRKHHHKTSHSRKERPRQDDDVSSSSSGSSTSGRSTKSYTRQRPVEAAPRPASTTYHRPPQPPQGGYYGHNDYYSPPPPRPTVYDRPPPPSNARSMSYSWYNATTPLNL